MTERDVTLWVALRFGNLKWHYGPKYLAHSLMTENNIGDEEIALKTIEEGLIDLPGAITVNRSYQKIKIDTFRLIIPTEDFEYFYEKASSSSLQKFRSGDLYYKLHGWLTCAMFTPEQHGALIAVMEHMLPEVRYRSRCEVNEYSRRLSQFNPGVMRTSRPILSGSLN